MGRTLLDILDKIQYKEGWSFYVNDEDAFLIKVVVTCSRTGLPLTQNFKFDNWPQDCGNCESPETYLYECLRKVEFHEVGEWLIINGNREFDPHDPEAWVRHGQEPPVDARTSGGWIGQSP